MKPPKNHVGTIKSVVTIMITVTFCYLAVAQNVSISSELLGNIFFSVITYFFAKHQTESQYKGWTPPKPPQPPKPMNPDDIDELDG